MADEQPVAAGQQDSGDQLPPRVAVLMPTYGQQFFIHRAIASLQAQSWQDWQLIVVDDGSPDATATVVAPLLCDRRITYHRLPTNRGLGAALNVALDRSLAPLVAYLPSDDLWYPEHLAALVAKLAADPRAVLAYSGVRHSYNRWATGQITGEPLQLVQVLHRRTHDRWIEREEFASDDYDRLFWSRLKRHGAFVGTDEVSCEWVDHPDQLHKIMREPLGGINPFRARYNVAHPLRFHSTVGNPIDEVQQYRQYRERPVAPRHPDGLQIVLAGELAYNADRVLALEERGHTLYGLWTPTPYWFNTVGPLPFGHVTDLPRLDWQAELARRKPDVIYALLNWQTVPFVYDVLQANPGIPFVWHFKEGPFICLEKGLWSQLLELYSRADGQIYSSPELRDWFETVAPGLTKRAPTLILDGDLPKRDWFMGRERSARLSQHDGEWHTVVPGRPIGLHPWTVGELAEQRIHLHFYGDFTQGVWRSWIEKARTLAGDYLHLHPNVDQGGWVAEFSQYDAGWLHYFQSENRGDLRRSNWDDLNYPARMATLAAAGLPFLQADNSAAVVASQTVARQLDIGLFFSSMEELGAQLNDCARMDRMRENIWRVRDQWTFDAHADRLLAFFRQVIDAHSGRSD